MAVMCTKPHLKLVIATWHYLHHMDLFTSPDREWRYM